MPLALSDEHRDLASVVRVLTERHDVLALAHGKLEADSDLDPGLWASQAKAGWFALHLPETYGGQGFGLPELAIVVEELGRCVAPGPFLSTVIASGILAACGDESTRKRWLPALADGSAVGAVGFGPFALGGPHADVFVLARGEDLVVAPRDDVTITPRANLDHTRRAAGVEIGRHGGVVLPGTLRRARAIARTLAAAEASGLAHGCCDMATEYAKQRHQFGRKIGSFMAVKHRCADMRVAAEVATAAAWDAVRATNNDREAELSAAIAITMALKSAVFASESNIQVHGGIGFTWEHPAHLFMRRAGALAALFGPSDQAATEVVELYSQGARRPLILELPNEAVAHRETARMFLVGFADLPPEKQRLRLVDEGYLQPHWPRPWGRDAGPVEQLVIEEEFAGIDRPDMGIGGWITLTLLQNATPDQSERWIRQSLLGEITWCQLFSEPNAGSDAAGIQTRAARVDGGWLVNGQKVWTSGAQRCTHGFATVRTDPVAPKHRGITTMVVDLKDPGVTIRPLRTIVGIETFNEVFLDDVFVPDDDVVGPVNGGWAVARTALGNERVTIGSHMQVGLDIDAAVLLPSLTGTDSRIPASSERIGELLAEAHAINAINLRGVMRAVMGVEPSPEGNLTKLVGSEHRQKVANLRMQLAGPEAVAADGNGAEIIHEWLSNRSATIGGGTSEIARSQIGERVLGLPREPGLG